MNHLPPPSTPHAAPLTASPASADTATLAVAAPVTHYENLPVASVLCPPHLRQPIAAIYAFARTADDIADEGDAPAAERLAARAKAWERHADQLVVHARELAEHVDATPAIDGWTAPVRQVLTELADAVLNAVQDHVKALAVARTLGEASAGDDQSEYLSAAWRVQQAERHCDELLRRARRELATQCREQPDAVALTLGNELAAAIEQASDALLTLGWGLRERTMQRMGVSGRR